MNNLLLYIFFFIIIYFIIYPFISYNKFNKYFKNEHLTMMEINQKNLPKKFTDINNTTNNANDIILNLVTQVNLLNNKININQENIKKLNNQNLNINNKIINVTDNIKNNKNNITKINYLIDQFNKAANAKIK